MEPRKYEVNPFTLMINNLHVRLDINSENASSYDDKFTLYGSKDQSNYQSCKYKQVKTIRDDLISGDGYIDIVFTKLIEDLYYWFEINPGMEDEPYFLFEAIPYDDIINQEE